MDIMNSWLDQTNDVPSLTQAAQAIFQKIEQLPDHNKQQVYSQLRNDVRFKTTIDQFQPEPV